jgi:hypothetical protein
MHPLDAKITTKLYCIAKNSTIDNSFIQPKAFEMVTRKALKNAMAMYWIQSLTIAIVFELI